MRASSSQVRGGWETVREGAKPVGRSYTSRGQVSLGAAADKTPPWWGDQAGPSLPREQAQPLRLGTSTSDLKLEGLALWPLEAALMCFPRVPPHSEEQAGGALPVARVCAALWCWRCQEGSSWRVGVRPNEGILVPWGRVREWLTTAWHASPLCRRQMLSPLGGHR